MNAIKEIDESSARLKKFAEIYQSKMAEKPFMEIIVRYDSMSEAGLTVNERIQGDFFLETNRLSELLDPNAASPVKPVDSSKRF